MAWLHIYFFITPILVIISHHLPFSVSVDFTGTILNYRLPRARNTNFFRDRRLPQGPDVLVVRLILYRD